MINFATHPDRYRHWTLRIDGPVAELILDVDEHGGLKSGYTLKLNSYDLSVDIELHDAVQRLRFEHPEVGAVMVTSAIDRVFCAGANIEMLGQSSHAEKVNFCKFTNETRFGVEDASECSGQRYISVIDGMAAGGGYELALATDYIILVDDGSSAVSLPEVPLLAVLPGTGGLTRVVDKRRVRRDRADFFCTLTEGIRGKRALDWKFIDELVPRSKLRETATARAKEFAAAAGRPANAKGIVLEPLNRKIGETELCYDTVTVALDREIGAALFTIRGPVEDAPSGLAGIHDSGVSFWPLTLGRDLDDAILHLRANEVELGTWLLRTEGDGAKAAEYDALLEMHADDWLVREITLFLKRTFKRLDVSSRSMIALIEPGSCFSGTLLEVAMAADRSYMLDGTYEDFNLPPATVRMTGMNFGPLRMGNGLTRLETRLLDDGDALQALRDEIGNDLEAEQAEELGLVTFIPDDIDWEDEVRLAVEERRSFSPDSLTGMEASLRFAGPETLETKIFGRLTAWQNWIFQRPNAVGEEGALKLFGTGKKTAFDRKRV